MANATRDPLFRAAVANEIARAPAAADAIASVCLTCHAGLGTHALARANTPTNFELPYAQSEAGSLARDGVSCTLCHQILPANLGEDESFSGGYKLGAVSQIVGPYAAPFGMPMTNRTGFTPVQGLHIQESALCGSCHTLVTEALTPGGVATGHHMGEQLTYLEWRRSAFTTEGGGATPRSCQSCHMPDTRDDGQPLLTRLAHRPDGGDFGPLNARGPFSRHVFVGANTLLPKLLRQGRALLNPIASDAALSEAEVRARETLRTQAAVVSVRDTQRTGDTLSFTVRIENRTGHKFPSGYPSRRAFLHVRVMGGDSLLFESGAVDAEGRLLGTGALPLGPELLGGGHHPHRTRVTSASEVVVYESVMNSASGKPSFDLLAAQGYLKDNRLLPMGHSDASIGPQSTAPVGVDDDDDFTAGFDDVRFVLPVMDSADRIEVSVRYQTFAPRYLDELLVRATPEAAALRGMLLPEMLAPELVDETSQVVP